MDIERLNGAWNRLIERHEMLRAVFLPDGTQAILPSVGEYRFPVYDLRDDAAPEGAIGNVRRAMSGSCSRRIHGRCSISAWPGTCGTGKSASACSSISTP